MAETKDKYDKISEIARRRGFFWTSYEIYGGLSGFINWGHLGSTMKRKIEDKFRRVFLNQQGFYEIESPIITPEKVLEASGHVKSFKESMIECRNCKKRFRADHFLQELLNLSSDETDKMDLKEIDQQIKNHELKCQVCGGKLSNAEYFLTMFKTTIGPYSGALGYGRPEAAQGIFVEFRRLFEQTREKIPIGFATIGHVLRNEISPRQGPLRLREYTIIDLEFFMDPSNPKCPHLREVADETLPLTLVRNKLKGIEDPVKVKVKDAVKKGFILMEWQAYFMALAKRFLLELGIPENKQRFIEKSKWERAHYSTQGFDQEVYLERWGWVEVSGFNYRTDYDLRAHMKESGSDMRVFRSNEGRLETKLYAKPNEALLGPTFKQNMTKIIDLIREKKPKEILEAFKEKGYYIIGEYKILPDHIDIIQKKVKKKDNYFVPHVIEPSFGSDRLAYATLEYAYRTKKGRNILKLPREVAPIQVGVLPLLNKDGLPEKAKQIHESLVSDNIMSEYDDSGSIGRRYARFDEVGTPICITVDHQTLEDETVTLRDSESWLQVRSKINDLPHKLHEYFNRELTFAELA